MKSFAAETEWAREQKEWVAWLMNPANNPEVMEYNKDSHYFDFLISPKYPQHDPDLSKSWTAEKPDEDLGRELLSI